MKQIFLTFTFFVQCIMATLMAVKADFKIHENITITNGINAIFNTVIARNILKCR
jgi:hypothetical protein